jgi:transcriptional regulator of NAD metabolism
MTSLKIFVPLYWRHITSVYRRFLRVAHRPRPWLSLTDKVALIHRTGGSIWTEIFKVIKAAYKKLASKYHTDVNKTLKSEERMKDLNEAFEILGDIEKRRAYHPVYLENKRNDITNEIIK